jgi:hypothetical protein
MDDKAAELQQKLGAKPGILIYTLHAPADYGQLVPQATALPDVKDLGAKFDWVQAFYTSKQALETEIAALKDSLAPGGQLWLCWPKQSSGVTSDLSDSSVREIGLKSGLVDVKIVAIDQTWSALKFVYRLAER